MESIGSDQPPGCLFCRALSDPDDAASELVVWRPQGAIVLLHKFPYNSGDGMAAPAVHEGELDALDEAQSADLMRALSHTVTVLRAALTPEGFNIGANLGRAAGAGIPDHLHFHVVPRWNGDTNFMPVLPARQVVYDHLLVTAQKLLKAFASTR